MIYSFREIFDNDKRALFIMFSMYKNILYMFTIPLISMYSLMLMSIVTQEPHIVHVNVS
jgi:hypothetical protein